MANLLSNDEILQDRYCIQKVLAKGGMGIIYLAEDLRLPGKLWAIKELFLKGSWDSAEAIEQFKIEAQLLASLDHPNLARITDYFTEDNKHYLVMDYIEGENLEDILRDTFYKLKEEEMVDWVIQICDVLDYLHHQVPPIIFRDMKPHNVMITPKKAVKLIDFGIAKVYGKNQKSLSFIDGIGTPGYAPPEQYEGFITDQRSDIYSLGATMYHLFSNTHPEDSIDLLEKNIPLTLPSHYNPNLTKRLEKIILKAMELRIENRYQSVIELKEDLLTLKNLYATFEADGLGPDAKETEEIKVQKVEWPMFRGNKERTGYTESETKPPLKLLWKFYTNDAIVSSPVTYKGLIFICSLDMWVYCLDPFTSRDFWVFKANDVIENTPCVEEDIIYVPSADGYLYALDTEKGELLWKFQAKQPFTSSPVVTNKIVFVSAGNSFLSLKAYTGEQVWSYQTSAPINSSPAVAKEVAFVGCNDGSLHKIDMWLGLLIWKFKTKGPIVSVPALYEEKVYVTSQDGFVYCVEQKSGDPVWGYDTKSPISSSPAVVNSVVYVTAENNYLYALSAKTGEFFWKFGTEGKLTSSPTVIGKTVYFGSWDNFFYAVNALTGQLVWKHRTRGLIHSSVGVFDNIIYVASKDGYLYAFREEN